MSFVRPELRAAAWRWREALVGTAVLALGAWWGLTATAALSVLGIALSVLGALLIAAGLQRGRFRASGGPGVVRLIEGQLAYFGPLEGGTMSVAAIARLELDREARPPHWRLTARDGEKLAIPVNAEGSEALFDVFAGLPGIDTEAMLAALGGRGAGRTVLWQRRAEVRRLH